MRIKLLVLYVLIIIITIYINIVIIHSSTTAPKFLITNNIVSSTHETLLFESFFIPQPTYLLAAHSASLTILDNNQLLALWFAGSHEGKSDVNIWQAYFNGKSWSKANIAITPSMVAQDTQAYVNHVGNPVIYLAPNGMLHLFVVSVGIGGWSGSHINHFISQDNGHTWHHAHVLWLSPIMNYSNLVRTIAVPLQDGGFYLPIYHELINKYPEILRFDNMGNFINKERLNDGQLLQPSLMSLTEKHALVFMRNSNKTHDDKLYYQETFDGGLHWNIPHATNINNYDSSLAVIKIVNHQYLMVHNIKHRDRLALAISQNGYTWLDIYILESMSEQEFSYPTIQLHQNIFDIVYTWKRQKIKHVRFNWQWLNHIILDSNSHHEK